MKSTIEIILVSLFVIALGFFSWKAERWFNWKASYGGKVDQKIEKLEQRVEALEQIVGDTNERIQ